MLAAGAFYPKDGIKVEIATSPEALNVLNQWGIPAVFRKAVDAKVLTLTGNPTWILQDTRSQTCSACGTINEVLNLRDRTWQCSSCDTQLDRDRNAAVNIYRVGASTLAGEVVSPSADGSPR